MVDKTKLHLGQEVLVGDDKRPAVIDGLTQTFAGVMLLGGGYDFMSYDEISEKEVAYV